MKLFIPLQTTIPKIIAKPLCLIPQSSVEVNVKLQPPCHTEGDDAPDVGQLHTMLQVKLEHGTIYNIASLVPHGLEQVLLSGVVGGPVVGVELSLLVRQCFLWDTALLWHEGIVMGHLVDLSGYVEITHQEAPTTLLLQLL